MGTDQSKTINTPSLQEFKDESSSTKDKLCEQSYGEVLEDRAEMVGDKLTDDDVEADNSSFVSNNNKDALMNAEDPEAVLAQVISEFPPEAHHTSELSDNVSDAQDMSRGRRTLQGTGRSYGTAVRRTCSSLDERKRNSKCGEVSSLQGKEGGSAEGAEQDETSRTTGHVPEPGDPVHELPHSSTANGQDPDSGRTISGGHWDDGVREIPRQDILTGGGAGSGVREVVQGSMLSHQCLATAEIREVATCRGLQGCEGRRVDSLGRGCSDRSGVRCGDEAGAQSWERGDTGPCPCSDTRGGGGTYAGDLRTTKSPRRPDVGSVSSGPDHPEEQHQRELRDSQQGGVKNLSSKQHSWLSAIANKLKTATPWDQLINTGRIRLVELCCSPKSSVAETMENLGGKGSAIRCSSWNGYDLSTDSGTKEALKLVETSRPKDVWISTRCGPFCQIQSSNQRTPKQVKELAQKQADVMIEYRNAMKVARLQKKLGGQVHWEWPSYCEARRLDEIRQFMEELDMVYGEIDGCTCGLKDPKSGELIKKPWTIATTSETMQRAMNTRCQGNHNHADGQGKLAALSAYYTPAFARRAVRAMLKETSWLNVVDIIDESQRDASSLAADSFGVSTKDMDPKEKERILHLLGKVHRGSGHCSAEALARSLYRKGASPDVVALAKEFKCDVCIEAQRQPMHGTTSLKAIPPKWKSLESDLGEWDHPISKKKMKFVIKIDEGCRLRVGRIMFLKEGVDKHRNVTAQELKKFYLEAWQPYFGKPETLRVDPEGAWMSKELDGYFSGEHIALEPIPGQAHWQIGIVEEAIECQKWMMTKLAKEDPEMSLKELFSRALAASNGGDRIRGFTPWQHAVGRMPDLDGKLFDPQWSSPPVVDPMSVDNAFGSNLKRMMKAEELFLKWIYEQRFSRAKNSKARPINEVTPGALVFYWRKDKGETKGSFKGPARVLVQETQKEMQSEGSYSATSSTEIGRPHPGGVVWLSRGGRLLRADPRQLRWASPREAAYHEIFNPADSPWTMTKETKDLLKGEYVDLVGPLPPEDADDEAEEVEPEGKRGMKESDEDFRQVRRRLMEKTSVYGDLTSFLVDATGQSHEEVEDAIGGLCYWSTSGKAIEVSVDLPRKGNDLKKASRDLVSYLASAVKKNRREVFPRQLTKEHFEAFSGAKGKEVNKFLVNKVLETLPPEFQPPPELILRMRWVLEYKGDPETEAARIVVLGYLDPDYENRPAASPTATKTTRQLCFQYAAWRKFTAHKADVSGAFLQGREFQRELYVIPVPELSKALGIPIGATARLAKAAYGLVEAPLERYLSVCEFLESQGWVKTLADPCCWILPAKSNLVVNDKREIKAVCYAHVDDFVFFGKDKEKEWEETKIGIQERFNWKQWETGEFVQCGTRIVQRADFGFDMDQEKYVDEVEEIDIAKDRRKEKDAVTSDKEKTQMRGVLGTLGWRNEQSNPRLSAEVSLGLSKIPTSTVEDLISVNKTVQKAKVNSKERLRIHSFPEEAELIVSGWTDAAEANRPDGSSTKGVAIGMAPRALLDGDETAVTLVCWKSGKIHRLCKSAPAAEILAAVDTEDEMYAIRYQWSELCGHIPRLDDPDAHVIKENNRCSGD